MQLLVQRTFHHVSKVAQIHRTRMTHKPLSLQMLFSQVEAFNESENHCKSVKVYNNVSGCNTALPSQFFHIPLDSRAVNRSLQPTKVEIA